MKIHAGHIEVAVAALLNFRIYTICSKRELGIKLKTRM